MTFGDSFLCFRAAFLQFFFASCVHVLRSQQMTQLQACNKFWFVNISLASFLSLPKCMLASAGLCVCVCVFYHSNALAVMQEFVDQRAKGLLAYELLRASHCGKTRNAKREEKQRCCRCSIRIWWIILHSFRIGLCAYFNELGDSL